MRVIDAGQAVGVIFAGRMRGIQGPDVRVAFPWSYSIVNFLTYASVIWVQGTWGRNGISDYLH